MCVRVSNLAEVKGKGGGLVEVGGRGEEWWVASGCKLQTNGRTPSSNSTTGRRGWAWGLLWCGPFVMYIKFKQGPFHLTGHC